MQDLIQKTTDPVQTDSIPFGKQELFLLEANIDDLNPEIIPYALDKLFAANVCDAWVSNIVMKKNRAAFCLHALCFPEVKNQALEIFFRETSTLGVREQTVFRYALERTSQEIATQFGQIRIKIAKNNNGEIYNIAPEFSDCQKAAQKFQIPLKEVYRKILQELSSINIA